VVTSDPDVLQDKLQVLPERLAQLAETEAERFDSIKQKLLTVLHIVQIIAEDQDKQSQVQTVESLIKAVGVEQTGIQNTEPITQHEETTVDPDLGSDGSS